MWQLHEQITATWVTHLKSHVSCQESHFFCVFFLPLITKVHAMARLASRAKIQIHTVQQIQQVIETCTISLIIIKFKTHYLEKSLDRKGSGALYTKVSIKNAYFRHVESLPTSLHYMTYILQMSYAVQHVLWVIFSSGLPTGCYNYVPWNLCRRLCAGYWWTCPSGPKGLKRFIIILKGLNF